MQKRKMANHKLDTLSERINELQKEGFTEQFKVEEEGLHLLGTDRYFQPGEAEIKEHARFEGESNPDDMSVLYGITTDDGVKGTLVDAFGTYSSQLTAEFLKKCEMDE